jgi:ferredoxin
VGRSMEGADYDEPVTTRVFTVRIEPIQAVVQSTAQQPLLQACEAAGVVLPSSCRNGTCRTCMCRLLQGQVGYTIAWPGLLAEEKLEGWILPCVGHAETDLVIDAPAAHAVRPRLTNSR